MTGSILLFSGGLDSTVALFLARRDVEDQRSACKSYRHARAFGDD